MTKRQGKVKKKHNEPKDSVKYLLEAGSLADMRAAKKVNAEHLKYQWNYYSELARQRNEIQDELKLALTQTCIYFELQNWQRAVKYKYGLHPLSIAGSLTFIGGRFNTGTGVNQEVPFFPALYLAQDKDTALQEHLGQEKTSSNFKLSPLERALTNPSSETIVSVSGKLDKVFDLTKADNLMPFINLIKNFKPSKELIKLAKELNMPNPSVVKTKSQLLQTLLHPDWRQLPSQYDVPANSQIFGHLIYSSEIEGILYLSKFTGKKCLALFPKNFIGTSSFIELNDEVPHEKVPKRIDATNWRISEMDAKEIIS